MVLFQVKKSHWKIKSSWWSWGKGTPVGRRLFPHSRLQIVVICILANCSYSLRSSNGTVTSPEYPSYYDPHSNCSWLIDVVSGNATLRFDQFSFQSDIGCNKDRFEVNMLAIAVLYRLTGKGKFYASSKKSYCVRWTNWVYGNFKYENLLVILVPFYCFLSCTAVYRLRSV